LIQARLDLGSDFAGFDDSICAFLNYACTPHGYSRETGQDCWVYPQAENSGREISVREI
jgi:hypothetical protein